MRFSALLVFPTLLAQAVLIVPGATWKDTSGNTIQAHGAGFLKVNSTYYWFGEDKAANSALFSAVSCYTSTDLGTWTRQNNALTPIAGTMISNSNIVERPKVLFNKANSEYVMWFHSDTSNYGAAQVGVATSKTPCGPYTYKGSFSPLGAQSRDESVFQDDDAAQTAYLLYASDNNQNFKISRMDANYYNVTTQVNVLTASTLEAPGMLKRNGQYFLFASHTSGWAPNPNKYFVASNISGTFSAQADLAPESVATYYSQNAFDLTLGTNAIYAGDRWRSDVLGSSSYIWLPMSWASGAPQVVWADLWNLNIANGSYSVVTGTSYEAENGVRSGSSTLISDSSFSGGGAVGFLGNGGSVAITVQGSGAQQWVSLYLANGDSTWRNTTVSVNGGASVVVQQPNTGGGHIVLSVPVSLNLKSGSNTIVFGAGQSNYAADLDKIIVYPPQTAAGSVPPTTSTSSSTGGTTGCVSAEYSQCGGSEWTGCFSCVSGTTCQVLNLCGNVPMLLSAMRVLYVDRSIIVFNKPPNVVSQLYDSNTILSKLLLEIKHALNLSTTPYPVHRLDKGTTGCLVFARSKSVARELSMQFRTRAVDKTYLALVSTRLSEKAGQIRTPLKYLDGRASLAQENDPDGQVSETDWELVASSPIHPMSLLRMKLLTGRKHQLRIHLARVLSAPILGDTLYSTISQTPDRIFLHASQLSLFRYRPLGGKKRFKIRLVAPLPPDFAQVCSEAGISIDERERLGGLAKSESGKEEDYQFIPDGEIPEVNGLWCPQENKLH